MTPFKFYMSDKSNITQSEIIKKLNCGYTYIYFYNNGDSIKKRYEFLLKNPNEAIEENTLFKIIKNEENIFIEKIEI